MRGAGYRFFSHCLRRPRPKNQSFQQRIAREAVCPMTPARSDFAGRIQTPYRGTPVQIRTHTAHVVMSRRSNWDVIASDVDTILEARRVHMPKFVAKRFGRNRLYIQEHSSVRPAVKMTKDRAADLVSGQ